MAMDADKRRAAEHAIRFVEDGMKLGLGTGSTARHFVDLLGERIKAGLSCVCVATSDATQAQAAALGIPLATLDEEPFLDLTVDGADEIDSDLRLIKGGGGALLREKIIATASERMIVIADASKRVETLGRFPLPIEVVPFGLKATEHMIELIAGDADCQGELRLRTGRDGRPYVTDGGHFILDAHFGAIGDPEALAEALQLVPGVVEHGLFLGLADLAIIAGPGGIEVIESPYADEDET